MSNLECFAKVRAVARHLTVLLAASLFVLTISDRASAYFQVPEDLDPETFQAVAGDLRCPTCTGLSVLNSDEKFATQIKESVVEQLRKGKSRDEILAYFTERYGPWILREPPKQGFHLLAWLIPIGTLLFGPLIIWIFVWKRRMPTSTLGMRTEEAIIAEMQERLVSLKSGSLKSN